MLNTKSERANAIILVIAASFVAIIILTINFVWRHSHHIYTTAEYLEATRVCEQVHLESEVVIDQQSQITNIHCVTPSGHKVKIPIPLVK